jgi:hypothetical protein
MVMTWVPGFAWEDATGWMWISRIGSVLGLRGCTRGRKTEAVLVAMEGKPLILV